MTVSDKTVGDPAGAPADKAADRAAEAGPSAPPRHRNATARLLIGGLVLALLVLVPVAAGTGAYQIGRAHV